MVFHFLHLWSMSRSVNLPASYKVDLDSDMFVDSVLPNPLVDVPTVAFPGNFRYVVPYQEVETFE